MLVKVGRCIKGAISYIMPKFLKEKIYTSNITVMSTCFAKKITILNVENKMAYSLERNYSKAKECLKEYKNICKIIKQEHENINEEWKNKYKEITNLDFWSNYLEITKEIERK